MKILGISGSPRKGGNTELLVRTALDVCAAEGAEVELLSLAGKSIHPCTACGGCKDTTPPRCTLNDPDFDGMVERFLAADGILVGSPVYFSSATPETLALLDRVCYVTRANGGLLRHKVGAAIAVGRRAGQNVTFAQLNYFFLASEMFVPGSSYWNIAVGRDKGEAANDQEGMETVKTLAKNMMLLLTKLGK